MEQVPTCGVDAWRYVWYGTAMYANIQQKSIQFGHDLGIRMYWMKYTLWQWLSAAQYASHFTGKQARSVYN